MKSFGWCIFALAACAVQVQGYSSGGPLCSLTPRADHGTLSENSAAEIEIRDANNNAVSEYVGGTTYTYWVSAPGANTYKGYTVVINQGTTTQTAPSSSACAGTMSTASNGQVRDCSGCNYASHNNGQDKSSTSGTWVAPATGTGTITVQFMWTNGIGSNFARWAAKQFNEQPGGTPSPSPSPAPPASCTTPAAPCSGHGACSIATAASGATSISCACQSLWSGDGTCSTCTPGWTLTNGACTLAPTSATVVTLFFTGSLDTVAGAAGSDSRSNFVDALEAAVEALLGLSASGRMLQSASGRVRVTGLSTTASGFDSDVTILPGSAGQPNVTALASTLVAGARDSSSSLYSAPLIGAALDASTNAASASSTVTPTPSGRVVPSGAGCPSFAFSADLTDGLTLQWSIATSAGVCLAAGDAVPSGAALVGQLTHANAGTWLSMGFNDAFAMVGTDAILGLPATSEVRDVHITGRSGAGVVTDASNDLTGTGISSTGSTTVMTFTRPLDTGDSDDMDIASAVASEQSVRVIWAHGAAGSGSLTNHGSTRRGNILVNFATGETEEAAPDGMRLAHGIMMTIAWAVMVPLGVLSAVWVKPGTEARCCGLLRPAVAVDGSVPQTWFLLHWRLQMGATLLSTIAFILAIVFTGGAPPATLHASLGIVVYVLMALHVIAGLLRPGKPKAPEPSASAPPAGPATPPTPAIRTAWEYGHRIVGSLLPLLALVAIISGYLVFGSEVGIAVGVPLGLLAASLAFGVCTLRSCVPDQTPGKVAAAPASST